MLSRHVRTETMAYLTTLYQMQMLFIAKWEEECASQRVHKKEIVTSFKLNFRNCCSN